MYFKYIPSFLRAYVLESLTLNLGYHVNVHCACLKEEISSISKEKITYSIYF